MSGLQDIGFYIQIPASRVSVFPDGTRETDFESMDEHDPEVLMSLFKQGETVGLQYLSSFELFYHLGSHYHLCRKKMCSVKT